jgi:hypothetical protein
MFICKILNIGLTRSGLARVSNGNRKSAHGWTKPNNDELINSIEVDLIKYPNLDTNKILTGGI